MLFQCGCAAVAPSPAFERFERRAPLGGIAVVPARYVPESNFVIFARSRPAGAAKGAAIEAGTTTAAFAVVGAGATGMGAAALGFIAPFAIVAGAAAGAISGSLAALPATKVAQVEAALRDALAHLDMQHALSERLAELTEAESRLALRQSSVDGPLAFHEEPSYSTGGVDTVIEVAVREVGFESCGPAAARGPIRGCVLDPKDPAVALYMLAQIRVVRPAGGTPPHARQWRYASAQRRFDQWMANDGRLLLEGFERGYRELAERIVDDIMLAPTVELPNLDSRGRLPGAHPLYGICWLAPVHPRAQPLRLSEALQGIVSTPKDICPLVPLHFATVDSLQPTLRWSGFPRDIDREKLGAEAMGGIADVDYELRLWQAQGCERGRLVLQRSHLASPEYRLEEQLVAGQRYFWSFRARFTQYGRPMATPWSLFDPSSCIPQDNPDWQYHRFVAPGS